MSRKIVLRLWTAVGSALLVVLALAPAAFAATGVTTTADGVAGSLREAVEEAQPNETIVVPTGTYKLTLGELEIKRNISLVGSGPGATVIEGSGIARVLKTTAPGELRLEHLSVRGGRVHSTIAQGAGILDTAGHLVLRDVAVVDNIADATEPEKSGGIAEGGGLSTRLKAVARVTIVDSTFDGDVVDASGSGGNSGGLAEGGALNVVGAGALEISGSTFVGNKALSRGGGVADGGAIHIRENLEPGSITTSTVAENFVESGSSAVGGGIFVVGGPKSFEIDRVTVTANKVHSTKATGLAGGIEGVGYEGEPLRVIGSTIVGNSADHGGNLEIGDATEFADTVVSGGISAPGEENCTRATTIVSRGFNLDDLDQCDFGAPGDIVDTDPQLGPLAANGGPTLTMLPAPTSPLVDAGASFGLTTDQRGLPRPIDDPQVGNSTAPESDGAEIGAVELPPLPPAPPQPPAPPAPRPPAPPATSGTASGAAGGPGSTTTPAPRLKLGKLTSNPRTGAATLSVTFGGPATGTLALSGKGLKAHSRRLVGATSARLVLATTGRARAALLAKGSRRVRFVVTFTPSGAGPQKATRRVTLTHRLL
jgi:hypothetical protein